MKLTQTQINKINSVIQAFNSAGLIRDNNGYEITLNDWDCGNLIDGGKVDNEWLADLDETLPEELEVCSVDGNACPDDQNPLFVATLQDLIDAEMFFGHNSIKLGGYMFDLYNTTPLVIEQ
jgi:hypothetical protein